jgi:hypothetical protein
MKIYYVNLITYFNLYNGLTIPKGIENLKRLISDKNSKIILSVLWEMWPHETILSALEILGVTPNQDNVVLLLDVYSYRNPDHWKTVNTVLYDSWLCRTHVLEDSYHTPNLDNDKFLFLLGKPEKKQRIFALYDLYQRNSLDNCEWALHYKPQLEDSVRCHLPILSDNDYETFITYTTRNIDGVITDFGPAGSLLAADLFSKASISLVTESTFHPELYWFITEKTWKAVKHFHPFVLLDYKKTYEHLHSLGIDTFQYAVKHPYESLVGSEEDVISMCVDNVLHMLDNKDLYREELTKSVIHNNKVFTDLANMYNNKITPCIEDFIWNHQFHKVRTSNAVEVYEKLWGKDIA